MPGEITLLAIGPLTNIALLFALASEAPRLLKEMVLMDGWYFDRPQPEWNIRCDPHAAVMVFAEVWFQDKRKSRSTTRLPSRLFLSRPCVSRKLAKSPWS